MRRLCSAGWLEAAHPGLRPPNPATEVRAPAGDVVSTVSAPTPIATRPAASMNTTKVPEPGVGGPPPSGTTSAGAGVGVVAAARVGAAVGAVVGAAVAVGL